MSEYPSNVNIPRDTSFTGRHVGPRESDIESMLARLGCASLASLVEEVVPESIRHDEPLALDEGVSEAGALMEISALAARNQVVRTLLGQGYHDCHVPAVIQRNVLENPGWYTAYTPYQPEIAQGRLEILFDFQTLITELSGLDIANASLLDEATAAAEAMAMAHRALRGRRTTLLCDADCHPQTLDVLATRAQPLGMTLRIVPVGEIAEVVARDGEDVFGVLVQYPGSRGQVPELQPIAAAARAAGALTIVAADLLALTLLESPGDAGADIVVGSAQRFGVPMGFGGPHAAFMATSDAYKRSLPGRLVGQSLTAEGKPAYRLALQTREQHIRREKATSNICTAQALLAIMAALYATWHGPDGLVAIARRVRARADTLVATLAQALATDGVQDGEQSGRQGGKQSDEQSDERGGTQGTPRVIGEKRFDTVELAVENADVVLTRLLEVGFNGRRVEQHRITLTFDETTTDADVSLVAAALLNRDAASLALVAPAPRDLSRDRAATFLSQAVFHAYRSETDMMRRLRRLSDRDIALDRAMIPLGSCTMKLNAAAEMMPITWPGFAHIHPFAPSKQTAGYRALIDDLERMLAACTGYDAVSLQPNAGSQGEYAGLLAIKRYHESRGETLRDVCLIPSSAHGTNPASAQMAGMRVVVVACDSAGNVDIDDLANMIKRHAGRVAAIMITYPSTHGVFEAGVRDVCRRVHEAGAQVYIDGANLNAMVGTAQPGCFGGDVSHLNLHKTFCIPHGGGGPGVGPIGVGEHLVPFLPGHRELGDARGAVSAAPWGSALILPITWMYIRMMGAAGLRRATEVAILNANYIAMRLGDTYPILYRGSNGRVAHECILDTRKLKDTCGITVDDIAKRLMDHGFHAPTMSFPVAGTLMVEPTESESLAEIDRFCEAMLSIHAEAMQVAAGVWPVDDNPLCNAPHTIAMVTSDDWSHPYPRRLAAWPAVSTHSADTGDTRDKYWPPVARIDNVHGDKHLICSCPPLSSYIPEPATTTAA